MHRKNKRILWLLNHKTLMPFEVKVLMELGFEVFCPKITPDKSRFRSGQIDFSYDSTLTIPRRVLNRLNKFDFYETTWPVDIVEFVNRYFGAVFIIPYGAQVKESLTKVEGQIVFRCFGLENTRTYFSILPHLYADASKVIAAIHNRFWFAQGYEQLAEVEPPLLADRSIYLPVGMPQSFSKEADSYVGGNPQILLICPNCIKDFYYADIYKVFKREFGDLPHAIIGDQNATINDPNVLGFVSDKDLLGLYQQSALFYYHSREPRHVHYSPIEAALVGMPVIYYADSLLGRLTPEIKFGRCSTAQEARQCMERILAGDTEYITAFRADQRTLPHKFSYEYCRALWKQNLSESKFMKAMQPEKTKTIAWRELKRKLLRPLAKGLSTLPAKNYPTPSVLLLLKPKDEQIIRCPITDGIDFTKPEYPGFIHEICGLSFAESGGRWSTGPTIEIVFTENLPNQFLFIIKGLAYGPNIGKPIKIKIGGERKAFTFSGGIKDDRETMLRFSPRKPTNLIEFTIPKPTLPPRDTRSIGIALRYLRIVEGTPPQGYLTKGRRI